MGMASPVSYSFSSVAYPIPSSFLQTLLLQLEPLPSTNNLDNYPGRSVHSEQ